MDKHELINKAISLKKERDTLEKKNKRLNFEIKKLKKQLTLAVVSNRRELLLGFQKSEYFDLYEQGVIEYKDAIEKYLT